MGLGADDWACVRKESFPDSEVNEYRHLRLHDFSDNVNALPRWVQAEAAGFVLMLFCLCCMAVALKTCLQRMSKAV